MLKAKNTALVIVDVQGKLATLMHRKEHFFESTVRLIQSAHVLNLPVFWNEQIPDKLGPTIPQISELFPGQKPMVKTTFSCCGNPGFVTRLESSHRKQVLLAGMETHVCVYQTALDLLQSGYEVHLVADAVSSRTPENRQIGIDKIKDAGGHITSVETAVFEMLGVAEGNAFKQIIKIVK